MNPQAGREQAGRRPAVILSPASYNGKTGLAVMCPVTSRVKGYPFEVVLPPSMPVTGAVLCDQVRNMDWQQRTAEFIGTLPTPVINEILARFRALVA